MATIEAINFKQHRAVVLDKQVTWSAVQHTNPINSLPQLFWADGKPWREVNLWLMEQALDRDLTLATVDAKAVSLLSYANWLEFSCVDWWHFPVRKADRCLNRYRGFLIKQRGDGHLAPATVTQRMRVAIQLYRWLQTNKIISSDWPLWTERNIGIHVHDVFGFKRAIECVSTDLMIPNRRSTSDRLEDGLLPISANDRDSLLEFSRTHGSQELYLMLLLGFFSGLRIQTISDLKIQTINNALPEPGVSGLYKIHVGPDATPRVATKYNVSGFVWITKSLLERLKQYAYDTRRLKREALADTNNKDLLFLTRFGNPYARRASDKSPAINVELFHLREKARNRQLSVLQNFHFHQSRCTFATELARLAIRVGGAIHAIAIVKEALLHRSESSSLKYIKFLEKSPIKEEAANEFTTEFLGLVSKQDENL
ncbi:site-specific integrase [Pseudomonas cavernicola]|uniref:Site-specific integrase n=1 Tax=Pseudomonas cavernicola TaxID=2320866 RepID=A0A418XKC7_9PSED|nr:site-specific integrase [Pseudomonas cavernicola]RJG12939.1 site-specific integrase [Pseudomonas cavernicola]